MRVCVCACVCHFECYFKFCTPHAQTLQSTSVLAGLQMLLCHSTNFNSCTLFQQSALLQSAAHLAGQTGGGAGVPAA